MKPPRVDRLQTMAWTATGAALVALLWLLGPILTPFVVGAVFSGFGMVLTLMLVARRVMGFENYITLRHIDAAAKEYGMPGNYVAGANIAGFLKVADAMEAQGVV